MSLPMVITENRASGLGNRNYFFPPLSVTLITSVPLTGYCKRDNIRIENTLNMNKTVIVDIALD